MVHLFYYSTAIYRSFVLLLDEAEQCIREGGTAFFLTCDGSLSPYCFANVSGNKNTCRCCRFLRKQGMMALSKPVQQLFVSDLVRKDDIQRIRQMRFEYQSVNDIFAITYRDVDIGYAALSHYICCTRNYTPTLTPELRKVMDGFLRTSVFLTDATEKIIAENTIHSAALFNGRAFDTRPFLRKCVAAGIRTSVFEMIGCGERVEKIRFQDSLPQNIAMQGRWIKEQWNKAKICNERDAVQTGHSFFQKRRSGVWAGDRVYITKQQKDMLPANWNASLRNIVFFTSSEDEFVAIDKEWEANKFAPTQIEGVRRVLNVLRDKGDIFYVYIRVHPNLANITFSYHTDLYTLEHVYPNVTVLPPDSPVSTYALIDHAEKIVVFGSTVGIEAVYWGKPVILIGPAYYQDLGACYIPRDDAELNRLLVSALLARSQESAIIYGYSVMGNVGKPFLHFDYSFFWPDLFLRKIITNKKVRILVLKKTNALVNVMMRKVQTLFGKLTAQSLRNVVARQKRPPPVRINVPKL